MQMTYSDKVKKWQHYDLVEHATNQLEEVLGPSSAGSVTGVWDWMKDERNRDLLTLQLRDRVSENEVVGRFAPDELRSTSQMSFRLSRLWGDLLQAQSEKLLKHLSGGA